MTLSYLFGGAEVVARAHSYPWLRLMTPGKYAPAANHTRRLSPWQFSTPFSAANFSGLCFLAGVDLGRLHTGTTPVGLIYAAVGGTSISRWMPSTIDAKCGTAGFSGVDFDAHILTPQLPKMALKSVLWYQVRGAHSERIAVACTTFSIHSPPRIKCCAGT